MLPTIEEQDEKLDEIKNNLKPYNENYAFKLFAKWYAKQVIEHCAEVAEIKQ